MALEHQDTHPEDYSRCTGEKIASHNGGDLPLHGGSVPPPIQSTQTPDSDGKPRKKPKWRKNVALGIEALGLVALIAYTVFSILQWSQIRWSNRLTRESLDGSATSLQQTLSKLQGQIDVANGLLGESRKQTDFLRKQVEVALGADVGIHFQVNFTSPNFGYLHVDFTNGGKTPAQVIFGNFEVSEVSLTDSGRIVVVRPLPNLKLGSNTIMPSSLHQDSQLDTVLHVRESDLRGDDGGRRAIKLNGAVTYFNGYSQKTIPLCYYVSVATKFGRNKKGEVRGGEGAGSRSCSDTISYFSFLRESNQRNDTFYGKKN